MLLGALAGASGCGGNGAPQEAHDPLLTSSVPLVVVNDCRRAAEKMDRSAVYCPPVVPKGPAMSQNRSSRGRVSITARGAAYQLNFVSSSLERKASGEPIHLGRWIAGASSPEGLSVHDPLRYGTFKEMTRGDGTRIVARRTLDGIPAIVVDRSGRTQSIQAGHVTVAWKLGERAMEVSLHGFEHRRQAIEMARAVIAQAQRCGIEGGEEAEPPCDLVFPARH